MIQKFDTPLGCVISLMFMLKKFKIHTTFIIPFQMEKIITLSKDILNRLEERGVVYKIICKKCFFFLFLLGSYHC